MNKSIKARKAADESGRIVRAQTSDLKFKTHEGRLVHDPQHTR